MSGDHAADAGPQDGVRAGGRLALMVARLERDVKLRPTRGGARRIERHDLRVVAAGTDVPALPHYLVIAHDDRPH